MLSSKDRLTETLVDESMTPSCLIFRSLHSPGLTTVSFLFFVSPVLLQITFHTVTASDRMIAE